MHFKKLEIAGFKSFADRTELEFHPGVTAIVGPNGCGKSNVSDSIKWVLGEQSARSLRGLRMEDIIFNGTASREPVNLAEVSITFSNEDRSVPLDYDEVVITRRLFRNGDSEYLINKSIVRLKDIHSLLAGTGLGVGNYSVIEQGRIDQILTARPEDRRALFEEAAGITRFKLQKKEALRNLEATELNLQRVTDIIIEQKRQISSLERQAKKAETYKRDFEKLKGHDMLVAREERARLQADIESRGTLLAEIRMGLDELAGLCGAAEDELASAREAVRAIDREYQETKSQVLILENQIRNNDEKIAIFSTYVEEVRVKLAELEEATAASLARVATFESEEHELNALLESIEAERAAGERLVEEAEAAFASIDRELTLAREEAASLRADLGSMNDEEHRQQSSLDRILQEKTAREENRMEIVSETQALEVQVGILGEECRTAQDEADLLSQEIRDRITEREKLEVGLAQDRDESGALDHQILALRQDVSAKRSKLELLEHFAKSHEGFSQGARFLLEIAQTDASWENRILGALADLVDVDRGFEVAVEAVLETLSQAIVCERGEDVAELSRKLKESHNGRAVLLRLDAMSMEFPTALQVRTENGLIRLADVTRAQERVSRLYNHLIRDIYVAVDADQAAAFSKRHPQAVFVTREGEVFRAMTVLAGSAESSEESMIFGREARVKELKNQLVEFDLDLERLSVRRNQLTEHMAAIEEALRSQGELVPRLQVRLADVQSRKEHRGNEREKLAERLTRMRAAHEELARKLEALSAEGLILTGTLTQMLGRKAEVETRFVALTEITETAGQNRESALVEITRRRSQFDTVLERSEQAARNLERLREGLAFERSALDTRQREQETLLGRQKETREQLENLNQQSLGLAEQRETLLDRHNAIALEKEDCASRLAAVETRTAELFERQQSDREKVHSLEMELERSGHEAQRLRERILANYQIDLNEPEFEATELQTTTVLDMTQTSIAPEGVEGESQQPLAAQPQAIVSVRLEASEAEELRQKLAKMGPVNLVAMEEYEDLQKRHEFLSREKEDLLRAKDDIHKALLKINRTTREMFIETFTKIQAYFVEYFKLLFGGGNAEIVLLDEGDVLESGIEIVARPPGKKLQSITLMSGGEKALTAIALMFAVFKVKPSPFCILDEIDAPLDESNVQRFANALQEFIKESQFIIITHNKRTMSVAEVLYGITMQRSGVSEVVSVKFGAGEKGGGETDVPKLSEAPSRKQMIQENLA